jgi:two-component system, OmpR family, sensor histidine kinase KdpD
VSEDGLSKEGSGTAAAETLSPDDLLAITEHELGNLATVLRSLANRLSGRWDDLDDQERRGLAVRVSAQTTQLHLLLANLRSLRADGTFGPGKPRRVADAAGVLRTTLADMGSLAPEHEVRICVDDLPPLRLDVPRLQQVLANVFANAARYAPPGTPITARVKAADGNLTIEVDDHGPGIPGGQRSAAFEKYERLDTRTSGSGLGLFVSRQLVETQGGSIHLEDRPGGGCQVRIVLPLQL